MTASKLLTIAALIAVLPWQPVSLGLTAGESDADAPSREIRGTADPSAIIIDAITKSTVETDSPPNDPPPPTREYEYASCADVDISAGQSHYLCGLPPDEQHEALECADDQTVSNPQYSRTRTINADGSRGPWGPWEWNDTFRCVDPEGPSTVDIRTILERDLATLPIPPSPLNVQPDQDWTYVNLDTIVFTDAEPTVLTTRVLDTAVEVRVTPVAFAWDFGDDSEPLVTKDPGKPYPHHTVAYAYPRTGEYTITLTQPPGRAPSAAPAPDPGNRSPARPRPPRRAIP